MPELTSFILMLSSLLVFGSGGLSASVYDTMRRGRQLSNVGKYQEAVSAFDSVIGSPDTRTSLLFEAFDARARCHKLLANYSLSLDDYDKALKINASEANLAIVSLNKSDLLLQTGRYTDAEKILNSIKDHNPQIRNRRLSNLASVYVRSGRFDKAENLYKSLITDDSNINNPVTLQNLGFLYMTQGMWDLAVDALKSAYPLFKENSADKYISLSNLALAEVFSSYKSDAYKHIESALDNLTRFLGHDHPDVITAKRKQAEILLALGNLPMAANIFEDYFKYNSAQIISAFGNMTTQGRLDFWKKERPLISLCFGIETENPGFLLDVALFRRGIALLGNTPDFDRLLSIKGKDIKRILKDNQAAVDFVVYPKRDSKGRLQDCLGAVIATKSNVDFAPLGRLSDIENYKVKGIRLKTAISSGRQEHIDAIYSDSLLTELIWYPVLEKLNGEKQIYFVPDGILNLLAIEYLPGLSDSHSFHRLTNLVNIFSRKKKRNNGKFLLAGGLDYNTLGDNMTASGDPNHKAMEFLKANVSKFVFTSLPGMKEEVDEIHGIYPDAEMTSTLSEERFKNIVSDISKFHISSHGYTLHVDEPEQPYLLSDSIMADRSLWASGLVLSGANVAYQHKDREDGLLSARELCDMNMSGVDFVVLSACQTADGKICDEGPAGLVRGLKKAGAKTIIATLWEVDDTAAKMFMSEFYHLRKEGISRYEAFRQARYFLKNYFIEEPELIAEYDPALQATRLVETGNTEITYPMSTPSMWAPFILIDNIEN